MSQHILESADGRKFIVEDSQLSKFIAENGKPYVPDPVLVALAPLTKERAIELLAGDHQAILFLDAMLPYVNKIIAGLADAHRKKPQS